MTDTMQTLDRMELRQQVLAQIAPVIAAEAAYEAAERAVDAEHGPAIAAALTASDAAFARWKETQLARNVALEPAAEIHDAAIEAFQLPVFHESVRLGEDELPVRCAKSGLPILDGDATLTDDDTGEVFLRAAVIGGAA